MNNEGGRWLYGQVKIRALLDDVAMDHDLKERYPRTALLLEAVAEVLYEAIDDLDLVLSGAGGSVTDDALENRLAELLKAFDGEKEDENGPYREGA